MKKLLYNLLCDKWVFLFVIVLLVDMLYRARFGGVAKAIGIAIELMILFFVYAQKKYRETSYKKKSTMLLLFSGLFFFTLMFFTQYLTGAIITKGIVYVYSNYIIFLYFAFFSKPSKLEYIGLAIKLITLIGGISVLLITGGDNGIFWRTSALIDKGFLTIFLALSQCLCITDIFFKKNILMNFSFLFFFLYINMFFVQSKTAFVSMGVYFLIMLFLLQGRRRRYLLVSLIISIIVMIMNADFLITESIQNAINVFLGNEFFHMDVNTQQQNMGTFEMRDLITSYSIMLFLNSPLWGIGIGGVFEMGGIYGVDECESTYLDLLVEGGILYFIPVFVNLIVPFFIELYHIKSKNIFMYQSYWIVTVLICLLICFYWNDFLWPIFFALIGICSYTSFNHDVSIIYKQDQKI